MEISDLVWQAREFFLSSIFIDSASLIKDIFLERFNNENAQSFDGGHAYFVGGIPASTAC